MIPVTKTITHGRLSVENVPHLQRAETSALGDPDLIIDGFVFYRLTHIFEYMTQTGITRCDYRDMDQELS